MNNGSNPTSAHPQAPAGGAEASRAFALAFAQILAPFVAHLAARLRWFRWLAPICPALARAIDQLERLVATLAAGDLPGPRHTPIARPESKPAPAAASEGHLPSLIAQPPAPPRQRRLGLRPRAAPQSTSPHITPRPSARRPRAHMPAIHRQHRTAARPHSSQTRCVTLEIFSTPLDRPHRRTTYSFRNQIDTQSPLSDQPHQGAGRTRPHPPRLLAVQRAAPFF